MIPSAQKPHQTVTRCGKLSEILKTQKFLTDIKVYGSLSRHNWEFNICSAFEYILLILVHPENKFFESKKHFFDIRTKKKFLWIEESFVD